MLIPREKVPQLELNLINGTRWKMDAQDNGAFTMIIFYRGLHCPICKKQLEELSQKLNKFIDRDVNVVAISMNDEKTAQKTAEKWNIPELPLAYGLTKQQATDWGLYLSKGISDKEPEQFSEPGLFLVKPDRTLYAASVQTMPFARPSFGDILSMIDYVEKENYPARGELQLQAEEQFA